MTPCPDFHARSAWMVTFLLMGVALINFLDKIVLGLVAMPLATELHLSPEPFGLIAGSVFWLFSTSTILVGPSRALLQYVEACGRARLRVTHSPYRGFA